MDKILKYTERRYVVKVFVNTMNKINNSWTLVTTIDAYICK